MAESTHASFQSAVSPNLRYDIPAGLVVFLVALPLCLGIALASGAPLFSGIIAGIIGGVVVGVLSGSEVSVSGPAAGLAVIVAASIVKLGSFEAFLVAVALAGVFQIGLGFLRAGVIGNYFPTSVIEGMLAAIGIVIFLKQLPHACGWDYDYEGDESFIQGNENTFTALTSALGAIEPAAVIISACSLAILILWETPIVKKHQTLKSVPAPLLVVMLGIALNELFKAVYSGFELKAEHLVALPVASNFQEFSGQFKLPDFSALFQKEVYSVALTIAVVASLESLLSLEAADKIDAYKRISDANKELRAQGLANLLSGLLGGLPITAVIVRTSANVYAGARTRTSAVVHGIFLFACALFIPKILNMIPLASLACILLVIGYKLAKLSLFVEMYQTGKEVFIPFVITVVAVVFTDLLTGIIIGTAFGLLFVLQANHHSAVIVVNQDDHYLVRFNKDMSFVNKSELKEALRKLPDNCYVCIDGTKAMFIDNDIDDVINDFKEAAKYRGIDVELKHFHTKKLPLFYIRKPSASNGDGKTNNADGKLQETTTLK
jgi:MFS superfamily sulfate permease-like transporter